MRVWCFELCTQTHLYTLNACICIHNSFQNIANWPTESTLDPFETKEDEWKKKHKNKIIISSFGFFINCLCHSFVHYMLSFFFFFSSRPVLLDNYIEIIFSFFRVCVFVGSWTGTWFEITNCAIYILHTLLCTEFNYWCSKKEMWFARSSKIKNEKNLLGQTFLYWLPFIYLHFCLKQFEYIEQCNVYV